MNLERCTFTLNKCLVVGQKKIQLQGRLVSFHTSNLRAEGLRV